jgi:hypothetical protein
MLTYAAAVKGHAAPSILDGHNTHDGTQTTGMSHSATHVTGNLGITTPSDYQADVDIIMNDSDDNAHEFNGASRTTGGIFRGKAKGNAPDIADLNMELETVSALTDTGRVLLFTSREKDAEPMSMKFKANEPLSSVLSGLGRLYSPIKNRNSHIYLRDNDAWDMKGRFSNAIRSHETLPWTQDNRGKLSVTLLAVSILLV